MIPIQQLLPATLVEVLRNAPLTDEKVAFAWRAAVGAAMNNVTAVRLHGDVLRVQTTNEAWKQEVERSAVLIRSRLAATLGDGIVRYLDVSVGAPRPRPAGGSGNARRQT